MLRAHPILGEGERFETERLARRFTHLSTEIQRWWAVGPFRAGVATFVDTGRTARRISGRAITDVDVGGGFRGADLAGEGLLAFRTLAEAIAGAAEISGDYHRHATAARKLAREFFDAATIARNLLEQVGRRLPKEAGKKSVPILGAIIGGACDSYLMHRILSGANLIYHKRFLHEKQTRIGILGGINPMAATGDNPT